MTIVLTNSKIHVTFDINILNTIASWLMRINFFPKMTAALTSSAGVSVESCRCTPLTVDIGKSPRKVTYIFSAAVMFGKNFPKWLQRWQVQKLCVPLWMGCPWMGCVSLSEWGVPKMTAALTSSKIYQGETKFFVCMKEEERREFLSNLPGVRRDSWRK